MQAKYSMEFCVAATLLDGNITIRTFTEERLRDPELVDLMKRVKSYVSPELVRRMVMSGEEPRLGGEETEITAFFSDVEGFSTFSEKLEPAVLVAGKRTSIKIGAGGQTRWSSGELERLVRNFRG